MPDPGPFRRILLFLVLPFLLLWGAGRLLGPAVRPQPGAPAGQVAVRLEALTGRPAVPLVARGHWRLLRTDGHILQEGDELHGFLAADELGLLAGPWRVEGDEAWLETVGDAGLRLDGRWYRGRLQVLRRLETGSRPALELRLHLDLEDYVLGVVAGEMATTDPDAAAALRAQAVAARTWALWRLHQGARVLSDTTADQRFAGVDYESSAARAAVAATAGRVLIWEGEILPAWYHAACAGHTASAVAVGFLPRALPPLTGVPDPGCREGSPWELRVEAGALDALAAARDLGPWLQRVRVLRADAAGRCLEARLDGPWASVLLRGEDLRRALHLPSAVIRRLEPLPDGSLRVEGAGRGHGVGLCQEGALRLARQGLDDAAILARYYPGARLAVLPPEEATP